ncbi:MAG: response regulator [Bacteroidales bacterium]|nr:response regulator [Bacteroidales bacterium]
MKPKYKILIIDDDESSIDVFEYLLEELNYEVFTLKNSLLALDRVREVSPQLIILDWIMPEKSGIEVLKEIKANSELSDIPIIISTGVRTDSGDLKTALDSGAFDFVRKPIDEIELAARVASAISTFEYIKQIVDMQIEVADQKLLLSETKAKLLQNELDKKERELIASTISILHNKKLIDNIKSDVLQSDVFDLSSTRNPFLKILSKYEHESNSFNWQMFETRFTELNMEFYKNLRFQFPELTSNEMRLCAFYKIGLSSKEIAILNFSNYEAVRKAVYRIRKKMQMNDKTSLMLFLQDY